jgi:hypothetical protein
MVPNPHPGREFVIKVTRYLTDGNEASPRIWLLGGFRGIIGSIAAAWIGSLALGSWPFTRTNKQKR